MYRLYLRLLAVCALFLVSIGTIDSKPSNHELSPNRRKYDGIDVSHHQGKINWKLVRKDKNIKFVYVKATQGTGITDEYYLRNIKGARRVGLRVGAYHYLSSRSSVRAQFKKFHRALCQAHQDLIPMIDVEHEGVRGWSKKQVRDSVELFARLIRKHYGKRALIYSQTHFYNAYLAPHFNHHLIFLGKYSSKHPTIKGKGYHNIWQYSDRGRVLGIKGYVDLDRFMSGTSLKHLLL